MSGDAAVRRIVALHAPGLRAELTTRRALRYATNPGAASGLASHVRAASAIRRLGSRLIVVQDDVNALVVADASSGFKPLLLPPGADGRRSFDDTIGNKHLKMDLEAANPDRVMQQLSEHELVPESWGGDTICVEMAAAQNLGVDDLLEQLARGDERSVQSRDHVGPHSLFPGVGFEARVDDAVLSTATVEPSKIALYDINPDGVLDDLGVDKTKLKIYQFDSINAHGLVHGVFTRRGGTSRAPWQAGQGRAAW